MVKNYKDCIYICIWVYVAWLLTWPLITAWPGTTTRQSLPPEQIRLLFFWSFDPRELLAKSRVGLYPAVLYWEKMEWRVPQTTWVTCLIHFFLFVSLWITEHNIHQPTLIMLFPSLCTSIWRVIWTFTSLVLHYSATANTNEDHLLSLMSYKAEQHMSCSVLCPYSRRAEVAVLYSGLGHVVRYPGLLLFLVLYRGSTSDFNLTPLPLRCSALRCRRTDCAGELMCVTILSLVRSQVETPNENREIHHSGNGSYSEAAAGRH